MRFTVVCNNEAIGEVELDPGEAGTVGAISFISRFRADSFNT
jgi:hypothetical protein